VGPGDFGVFSGLVECSSQGGGDTTYTTTQQSFSSMNGTTQDKDRDSRVGDGDGIPDFSDRCANNSNPRCFKEDTT
jgi:hypothetical protein